ncbi:RNA-guided endonuclease InsQ/TnpB family protein [Alteromonas facilis]|uniref:RNA-guided endonuclease InsQ/TnpB family protein n=1 Tax=Alteromonas facilis TaxID=2048004 RepID=UPI00196A3841|nr:RNA-guided endonuclease TnpB family protein [Alteromonas facilis]
MAIKTLQVRVKDKHIPYLCSQAIKVNYVWNYINQLSSRVIKEKRVFLSDYDIQRFTNGSSKLIGLHSQTIQEISKEYVTRRDQYKKHRLAWRKSRGAKRSLGWIPLKSGSASYRNGQIYFNRNYFKVWDSFGLSKYTFKSACFSEDSRGRWYFNVCVEFPPNQSEGKSIVGIDLGLKDVATDSNGVKIRGKDYQYLEHKLAVAQRARKSKLIKNIHSKIKNRRKDRLHKYSRNLVNKNSAIFIGNVSSSKFTKTRMAKSVFDAGWGLLRTMLEYKCAHAGIVYSTINEAYTTQSCSICGSNKNGPRGLAGLGIREWTCECGITHDRDINAAMNILALGHQRLAGGVPR